MLPGVRAARCGVSVAAQTVPDRTPMAPPQLRLARVICDLLHGAPLESSASVWPAMKGRPKSLEKGRGEQFGCGTKDRGAHGDPDTSRRVGSRQVTLAYLLLEDLLIPPKFHPRSVCAGIMGAGCGPAPGRFKNSPQDDHLKRRRCSALLPE